MRENKEHLTALAIKAAALRSTRDIPSDLAVAILEVVEEKLVGQIDSTDFKAAEAQIYKILKHGVGVDR